MMNDLIKNNKIQDKRLVNLHNERNKILSMSPEKALDAILDSPQALPLVHSFPEEDFYLLINDIGIEDSISLLNLASTRQWEYILDIDGWKKDRIELPSITKWFDFLLMADQRRLTNWVTDEKKILFEYYIFKNIEVFIREHDQDSSVFGDEFITLDDTYYIRFRNIPVEDDSEKEINEKREEVICRLLELIAAKDHTTYQKLLHEASAVLTAEIEEEAFRLRNIRLSEKGFKPFYEAIEIYHPLTTDNFQNVSPKYVNNDPKNTDYLPVSIYSNAIVKEDNLFTLSLKTVEDNDILQQIQVEFACLCNLIISADQKKINEREELKNIVKKACSFISIGLQRLTDENDNDNPGRTAYFIQKHPLSHIFRLGFGTAIELKWRAEKWINKSWFKEFGFPLTFWDEYWTGILGGILLKKPLFFDNYRTGVPYREFGTLEDISITGNELDHVIAMDHLFSLLMVDVHIHVPYSTITCNNLILTLWARNQLGLPEIIDEIEINDFRHFFNDLLHIESTSENQSNTVMKKKRIRISMKESFLNWLSEKSCLDNFQLTEKLGNTFERLFNELENEYGSINEKNLDSRYINMFLIKE